MEATAAPPTQDFTPHLAALHRAGYGADLHPIIPPGATLTPNSTLSPELLGKTPGRYSGDGRPGWFGYDWSKGPPARADTFYSLKHGGGLGTLTRDSPFLDCDILDAELSDAILHVVRNALDAHASPVRTGRAPKWAAPFRREGERFRKLVIRLEQNGESVGIIELLGDGQQIVLGGRHQSGSEYSWQAPDGAVGGLEVLAASPVASLPVISPDIVREKLFPALVEKLAPLGVSVTCGGGGSATSAKAVDQDTLLAPSVDDVRALVAAMENDADHKHYIEVARAIRGAVGESESVAGFEVFEEWAGRGKDGAGGRHPAVAVWESLRPPHGLGWSALQSYARAAGVNTAPLVFDADPEAVASPEVPARVAEMNAQYIVVPDGIYCHSDQQIRSVDKVRTFYASTPGLFSEWFTSPHRARARSIVFDPTRTPLALEDEILNTYPGLALTPDEGGDCSLFLAHLRDIVCSGDELHFRWVMSWLADIVQRPSEKCGTSLTLKGKQGSGKSVIGEMMRRIVGPMGLNISKRDQLLGRFTGHMERLLFVEASEAVWAGDPAAFGVLKDDITSTIQTYEVKGRTPHSGPSYRRILFTSNERRAVPVAEDDRRFCVLQVSDRYAEGKPGAAEYWSRVWASMDAAAPAFLHLLLMYPVDLDLIRHPLDTRARKEEQAESLSPLMQWLAALADNSTARALGFDVELAPGEFRTDELYASYLASVKGTASGRHPESKVGFARWLSSLSHEGLAIVNGKIGSGTRTKRFPPLPEFRAWLCSRAAMPDWDINEDWIDGRMV